MLAGGDGRRRRRHDVLEGDAIYTAYSRSRETGWTVRIGMPRAPSTAARGARSPVYGTGISLSIALGAAGGAVRRPPHRPPDGELRAAARALGRREPLMPPETPILEIREVGDSLAAAADERARARPSARSCCAASTRRAPSPRQRTARRTSSSPCSATSCAIRSARSPTRAGCSSMPRQRPSAAQRARAIIARQVAAPRAPDRRPARRRPRHDAARSCSQRQPLELAAAARAALGTAHARGPRSASTASRRACEPVWVDADPTRIEQIVANLLDNALEVHARRRARITRAARARGRRGGAARARHRRRHVARAAGARLRPLRAGRARRWTARRAASASA